MRLNARSALGALLLVGALTIAGFMAIDAGAGGGLVITKLGGPVEPEDLANGLVGKGITVSNVTYSGDTTAAGQFSGGDGIIGFGSGMVMSSGDVNDLPGPNALDDLTTSFGGAGDTDLETLSGFETFDAAVLEFDFVPDSPQVAFQYVFASDEYNEYVNTQYNDVFAFFINGTNCALVEGDPVSINTINNGNPDPGEDPTTSHPDLYVNNDLDNGGGSLNTEMDGLTTVLTCQAAANPGVDNHMKLAIADASDEDYDSAVFLQAGSFIAVPTETPTQPPTATEAAPEPTATATSAGIELPQTGAEPPASSGGGTNWYLPVAALGLAGAAGVSFALARRRSR
jgi:hypothetical protein